LTMPDADVEQSAVIGGRLHGSNLDRLKARGFHLTGTYARNLSVKDAKIDLSEWNEMGLPGANLENTEVYGSNFDYTDFSAHQRRQLPAANLRRFKVVRRRFSEDRAKYNESPTTFRYSNMAGTDLTQSELEEPDMSYAQLKGAKAYAARWHAPNLTKAGLAGLIGFKSLRLEPVPNPAPYKKHPLLALAQTWTSHEVNPTWDKWFKRPLKRLENISRKSHQTLPTVMKKADISGLDFKLKNLAEFKLEGAKAANTDFSQSYIGNVPVQKYAERILKTQDTKKREQIIKHFKRFLPKINHQSMPILVKNPEQQKELLLRIFKKEL
jgi:uncharacterized protein YjbI with pentapeptide repeats